MQSIRKKENILLDIIDNIYKFVVIILAIMYIKIADFLENIPR